MRILVTGATGYIGSRLIPTLLAKGHDVRALARNPDRAAAMLPGPVEVVAGDVFDAATLGPALHGVEVAYYLVHSMQSDEASFAQRDRQAAETFGRAAAVAGVQRIVYLGGLGQADLGLSDHLRSRQEVGAVLAASGVSTTEFRAGTIIGAGSVPFEMLRELTERLPLMVCPRWVTSPIQPIAVAEVLQYLTGCLAAPQTAGRVIEIGGPEVMTYQQMMLRFARLRGLHRLILRVPVLTPRLSSYWVDIVTSVPASLARPLIEGLRSAVVVRENAAASLMPMALTSFDDAVRAALAEPRPGRRELPMTWLHRLPAHLLGVARNRLWPSIFGDQRTAHSAANAEAVYAELARLGGRNGWYALDWAWRLRGALDRRLGGPGLDRRTELPPSFTVGERRDFWQVTAAEPGRRLRLRALMRVPGAAELEWTLTPAADGGSAVRQTASFRPTGLAGRLYWYALRPIHTLIFARLVRAIAQRAGRWEPRP